MMVFVRAVSLLAVVLLAMVGGVRAGYGVVAQVPPMPRIFADDACTGPCWQGIEPGRTRTSTVESTLAAGGFTISTLDISRDGYFLSFEDNRQQSESITYNIIRGQEGVVTVVAVTEAYCPTSFLAHYGLPAQVFVSPTPDKHQDIVLHYPQVPITMWVDYDLRAGRAAGVRATTLASNDIFADLFQPSEHTTWADVQPMLRTLRCESL